MLIVTVVNQKGGVGKTTTCINLGAELAEMGNRVLLADCDPQGNGSSGLGYSRKNSDDPTMYDVLVHGLPACDAIVSTQIQNFDLLPSNIMLAGAELELTSAVCREFLLARALADLAHGYDLVLVDCPPSLGLLTVNGLTAADRLLVPVQSEYYALEGLSLLNHSVEKLRIGLQKKLQIDHLLVTMFDRRINLAQDVVDELSQVFGDRVLQTKIPRNVSLAEAPSYGCPVKKHAPSSMGAQSYRALAEEVAQLWQLKNDV